MENRNKFVQVVVRCRPVSKETAAENKKTTLEVNSVKGEITVIDTSCREKKSNPETYTFDHVYDCTVTQEHTYKEIASPIVNRVLQGYDGTILAFGNTHSGRTYTLEGNSDTEENKGIIPRAFEEIFEHIEKQKQDQFMVQISFIEIFKEEIRDLLSDRPSAPLCVRENAKRQINMPGLIVSPVRNIEEMYSKYFQGQKNKVFSRANQPGHPRRSITIFSVTVESWDSQTDRAKVGKLSFFNFGFHERAADSEFAVLSPLEGMKLCKYTSDFFHLVEMLRIGRRPLYQSSKLSKLIRDCFGGKTATAVIVHISPAQEYNEVRSVLNFTEKNMKKIYCVPVVNKEPEESVLKELRNELSLLKEGNKQPKLDKIILNPSLSTFNKTKSLSGKENKSENIKKGKTNPVKRIWK